MRRRVRSLRCSILSLRHLRSRLDLAIRDRLGKLGGKSPVLAWAVGLRNCVCTAAPGDQAIRAFHGPLVDLPRGPPHVGLSWWRDPGFHQVSHFLFFFYNIDTYTLYDIPIYNTMLADTAGYASAYLAYPVAPPLTSHAV